MAEVIQDDLWFCVDCTLAACNGDTSGIDSDEQRVAVLDGLDAISDRWGGHIVPNFDSETGEGHEEFATMGCDCCGSMLAGEMHRFAILS